MDRSPDHMDLDVEGDDGRETAWWERLTKDSVRMQELVGKLNPACFPIDSSKSCPEVDDALEVYYGLPPPHARSTPIPIPNFSTARAHTILVINHIFNQNHRKAGASKGGMGALTMSLFLKESYPKSAPFNGEALHSRADDQDFVASSHGSSDGLRDDRPLSHSKGPRTGDRFLPHDSQPHPHYGHSTTHTLSNSTKYNPGRSNSDSPGASGGALSDSYPSADESTISSTISSTRNNLSRPRVCPQPRSVLNRVGSAFHIGSHFDVPPSKSVNGTAPVGQHKCDVCSKTFPYPSKLEDHKFIHRPDKPLPCDHPGCSKKFKRTRELRAHKKTHERKAAGISRPQHQYPILPPLPPAPRSFTPPRHLPSPLSHDECSPKSEPPFSDRTSSTSQEDECTLSGSPSPASSHTNGRVASPEPPVVHRQQEKEVDLKEPGPDEPKFPTKLSHLLDRQLFPGLQTNP
ncbi:hypothetical protein L873DRAFT_1826700 [Choiromyces venosus 120613-1]|uniref:C2H2-type domain-containing protein n=1 Tax=Choiromyces venosus 120613-1 TaxID=1336337 RepID=A0A3N4JYF5_9PEZI|nr:hypothetical protein L873DRAFT_1826700 [Choiromyces venosus 120613-1]